MVKLSVDPQVFGEWRCPGSMQEASVFVGQFGCGCLMPDVKTWDKVGRRIRCYDLPPHGIKSEGHRSLRLVIKTLQCLKLYFTRLIPETEADFGSFVRIFLSNCKR